jgi:C-terminal processing protease CtpA/Prc
MIGWDNLEFTYSGLGVFFPDNTSTQGVGIEPDTCITETKAEFIDGEDVILQNTIDLIQKKRFP